jgi:hypothetical protein
VGGDHHSGAADPDSLTERMRRSLSSLRVKQRFSLRKIREKCFLACRRVLCFAPVSNAQIDAQNHKFQE